MGKIMLIIELFFRSILPPFYSFSMIERICKKKLKKEPFDKNVLWVLGNLYLNYGMFGKAKYPLESLYKMGKKGKQVSLLLARVYYNLNQHNQVKEILADKEVLSPNDPENYYLGDSLIQLKEFAGAAKHLAKYVEFSKKEYIPFVKLGYAYYMQGLFGLAISAYEEAEKLEPTSGDIRKSIELCKIKEMERHRLG